MSRVPYSQFVDRLIESINSIMKQIIQGDKTTWVDITKPTQQDVEYLKSQYNFHPMVLDELIPRCYHPRLEVRPDYLFLIINYPLYHEANKEVVPRELDIILTKDTVVTNRLRPLPILENFFKVCQRPEIEGEKYLEKGSGFVLFSILDIFWLDTLKKLDNMDDEIEKIERKIFQGKEKEMVKEISHIKTDIIDFWRIIDPQFEIMKLLGKEAPKFFGEEFSLHFSDVLQAYERVWQTLKAHKETILAMEDTNRSLLTIKTNEIIKILTIFSLLLMPPTLLASIWGMNVQLPFGEREAGFWIIAALMISTLITMFYYFRKKRWL